MNRIFVALFIGAILALPIHSQSGRRIKTKPVPAADTNANRIDENVYSESRPFKPVLLTPRGKKEKRRNRDLDVKPAASQVSTDEDRDDDIISVDSSLVTIPVSVFDSNGIFIPHIRKEEFKIFEDGIEQEIAYFGNEDQPFTVALVIDTSGSTQFKIEDIQYAAKLFVRLLEERDKVIVIQFSDSVRVRAEATNDRAALDRAIDKTRFGGGTSLYEAVEFSLKRRLNKIEGRKAIVLFTDGVDTTSRGASYRENLEDAEEADTIIFPVFYNTFLSSITGGTVMSSPFPTSGGMVMTAEMQTMGKVFLEELASFTGGRVFHAGQSRALLVQAFQGIAEELRAQYSIGYSPIEIGEPGDRKQIKVRVYRPDLRVRARDSYIVGEVQTKQIN